MKRYNSVKYRKDGKTTMPIKDPPFEINAQLLTNAAEISETVGRLSAKMPAPGPVLRRINRVRTIRGTLAIEQNTLNIEQVTAILNGKHVIAPPREIAEVRNACSVYEKLGEYDPFSTDSLLAAHGAMMRGLIDEAGTFRSGPVGVADSSGNILHVGTLPRYVPESVENLLKWVRGSKLPMIIKSCVFHYEFELIHPFADGNGRMGRLWHTLLLATWEPLFAWLPVESVIHDRQEEYYDALNASNIAGTSTAFIGFMLSAIKEALNEAAETAGLSADPSAAAAPSEKEKPLGKNAEQAASRRQFILNFLSVSVHPYIMNADVCEGLGVSSATANRILTGLCHDGTLKRIRAGKYWAYQTAEKQK